MRILTDIINKIIFYLLATQQCQNYKYNNLINKIIIKQLILLFLTPCNYLRQ
jgi:hypothetical protein